MAVWLAFHPANAHLPFLTFLHEVMSDGSLQIKGASHWR